LAQVVFIMLGIGLGAVLLSRSNNLLVPSLLGLGLLGFGVGLFLAVQRFGLFMSLLRVLDRVGIRIAWLKAREGRLEALDSAIRDFYVRDRRGFLLSFASFFAGWLAGAVEVYLILYFLGLPVDWRTAIAIEALAVFAKGGTAFIPGSVGGQEAGTVLVFVAFGLTEGRRDFRARAPPPGDRLGRVRSLGAGDGRPGCSSSGTLRSPAGVIIEVLPCQNG